MGFKNITAITLTKITNEAKIKKIKDILRKLIEPLQKTLKQINLGNKGLKMKIEGYIKELNKLIKEADLKKITDGVKKLNEKIGKFRKSIMEEIKVTIKNF